MYGAEAMTNGEYDLGKSDKRNFDSRREQLRSQDGNACVVMDDRLQLPKHVMAELKKQADSEQPQPSQGVIIDRTFIGDYAPSSLLPNVKDRLKPIGGLAIGVRPVDAPKFASAGVEALHASCRLTEPQEKSPLFDTTIHPVDLQAVNKLCQSVHGDPTHD